MARATPSPVRLHPMTGTPKCRARAKHKLAQGLEGEAALCDKAALIGQKVCELHGANGGSPVRHGRYSQVLNRMKARYNSSLNSADLLSMEEQIAMLDTITQRVAERLEAMDTVDLRTRAVALSTLAAELEADGQADEARNAYKRLHTLLRRGVREDVEMERLGKHAERLSRRIEAAWNVRLAKQNSINQRDLVAVLARFVGILQDELQPADAVRCAKRIELELNASGAFAQQRQPQQIGGRDESRG